MKPNKSSPISKPETPMEVFDATLECRDLVEVWLNQTLYKEVQWNKIYAERKWQVIAPELARPVKSPINVFFLNILSCLKEVQQNQNHFQTMVCLFFTSSFKICQAVIRWTF